MSVLIVSGAPERGEFSTSERLSNYLKECLDDIGIETDIFKIVDSGIPFFDFSLPRIPNTVKIMNKQFRKSDVHIWLTPLYHGSMTGIMKNCFDWLEISAKEPVPYLSGKIIGLVCWADGVRAMQGINAMESVAKALRAWTAPYSVPIQRGWLFKRDGTISEGYKERFKILLKLLMQGNKNTIVKKIEETTSSNFKK